MYGSETMFPFRVSDHPAKLNPVCVPGDGKVRLAPPVVNEVVAGEMLPPFEMNATENVEPDQRA